MLYVDTSEFRLAGKMTSHVTAQWSTQRKICRTSKGPVTQNSASKSRTKSHENLVDVVVSGNFWSILAWPCFERGLAVSGCSTAETLPKHGLPLPATCKVKNRFARV